MTKKPVAGQVAEAEAQAVATMESVVYDCRAGGSGRSGQRLQSTCGQLRDSAGS